MSKIPKLILGRPKIVVDVKCPKCKSQDIKALPIIETSCNNCNTKFTAEVKINLYYSIAKKLLQTVAHNNEMWVVGERADSHPIRGEDLLKPQNKHDDDLFQTLCAIKNNFEGQKCYEASEITYEMDLDYKVRCSDCGYCSNCVTCTRCNKKYVPNITKTDEKRYSCPDCRNKNYKPSYIKFKKEGSKISCPNCDSENVNRTGFVSTKKECPKCHSKSITTPRKIPIYKLVIKRQRRNLIRDDD